MEARVEAIAAGAARERVWLVEHPPLYTAGTSARDTDLLDARFPVHRTGRGGQYTYHGPGQRVAYVMLDLKRRRPDVRAFVGSLEGWLIDTLAAFGVAGETRADRVGVWVARPGRAGEDKIAAIGVRVRRWVTFHGVALNVAPDLARNQPRGARARGSDGGRGRGAKGGVRAAIWDDRLAPGISRSVRLNRPRGDLAGRLAATLKKLLKGRRRDSGRPFVVSWCPRCPSKSLTDCPPSKRC
jgi:lipoate-protein ligase B